MAEGFKGMAALLADLQALGPTVSREAGNIIQATTNSMALDVKSSYPSDDGDLRKGVVIDDRGPLVKRVRSRAKHAHIFERGTVRRRTHTGADRGTMPPGNVFVPRAIKWRARMVDQLVNMVERQKVRGMDGQLNVVARGGD